MCVCVCVGGCERERERERERKRESEREEEEEEDVSHKVTTYLSLANFASALSFVRSSLPSSASFSDDAFVHLLDNQDKGTLL